jgi:acyl-CoA synthetase (AMP-forming)/AMP-acid ligase II
VADAVVVGAPHATLGQGVVAVVTPSPGAVGDTSRLLDECRKGLPTFMVPLHVEWREALPRNPNGKFDRPQLAAEFRTFFAAASA